jgi:cation transport regulator ChaB
MPYSKISELPPAVKKAYTKKGQEAFLAAFNSAFDGTCKDDKEREACAFAIAHSAAQKAGGKKMEKPKGKLTSRMLTISLADKKFEEVEGGLIVRGAKILAAGTWTDSYQQTPCNYSAKLLEQYAANWKSNGFWLRHAGGSPRSIDEKVGEVINPRFENDAVIGDVFLHLASSRSRDYAEMAKRGVVEDVSAELGTMDSYDKATKTYNATYLEFTGVAAVDKGACKVCGLRGHSMEDCPEEKGMEPAEVEKMLADFKTVFLSETNKMYMPIASPVVKPEELKALSDKLDTANKAALDYQELNKALEVRLKKLEAEPNPKTLAPVVTETKEMEIETAHLPRIVGRSIIIG